jgi:hypothetical protein
LVIAISRALVTFSGNVEVVRAQLQVAATHKMQITKVPRFIARLRVNNTKSVRA